MFSTSVPNLQLTTFVPEYIIHFFDFHKSVSLWHCYIWEGCLRRYIVPSDLPCMFKGESWFCYQLILSSRVRIFADGDHKPPWISSATLKSLRALSRSTVTQISTYEKGHLAIVDTCVLWVSVLTCSQVSRILRYRSLTFITNLS